MPPRRALLRHLWAMVQTRAEAASLVVRLQRTAVTQGLLYYGIAAITALSFMTAVIVWIAVAAPPAWRGWALGALALALLAAAVASAMTAGRRIRHDAGVIADFSRGLKLDLAMINLALKDPETDDEEKVAERERAKTRVREAAADKAETSGATGDGGVAPETAGPAMDAAAAAIRAAPPRTDVNASPEARDARDTGEPPPAGVTARAAMGGAAFAEGGTFASAPADESLPTDDERVRRHGSA